MTSLEARLEAVLGDAYRLEREIAGGGMSRLFLATEASLERKVVIKVLPPDITSDVSAARFQRETLVAAQLQHPHILPVLSSGARNGLYYYVMPYVPGESLRHRLEREGKLSVHDAICILREVADALAYAHKNGVVHRDIKPANILLEDEHAVLCDFGIARALEGARGGETGGGDRLTGTGMSLGTIGYMAPEQLVGDRDVDARADVYALAVVGYEMLAGAPPFTGPTAQAVLGAHLTQSPPLIITIRPEVPVEISDAISRALAKTPDERLSASQFRAALDLPTTTSFPVASRAKKKRRLLVALGALFFVLATSGIAAYMYLRPSIDNNRLAVAPFDVRDADTTWREGLVDVLSRKLDGAGPISAVSATLSISRWSGRADRASALELGKRTGAGLVVFGSLHGYGRDSVTLSAAVLDVVDNRVLGGSEIERRGSKLEVDKLADSITVGLLREIGKTRSVGASRQTSLGANSFPALKAFLLGEQWYRRTAWDSALAYYERAIAEDSTFALAYRHAGLALSWQRSAADTLSRAYLLRAGRWNRGLSTRDSLLVTADSIRSSLVAFELDTAHLARTRRLFATLDSARRRYHDDPEVWFALGDAHFHFGGGPGVGFSDREMLAAFDSAIALDSAFAPAYIHAIELGFTLQGAEAGQEYARRYLNLEPTDADAEGILLIAAALDPDAVDGDAEAFIDTASTDALFTGWRTVRRWPDSAQTGVRLAQLNVEGRRTSGAWFAQPAWRRLLLSLQLAYRGRLGEALNLIGTNIGARESRLFAELAFLGGVPTETARAVFARLLRDEVIFPGGALPWWAERGDTASIKLLLRRSDSLLVADSTSVGRRDARYRSAASRAYLALARYDTVDAIARFAALPDTECLVCYLDRLVKARLFTTRGRNAEAYVLLAERLQILLSPSEILFALERARVAERLGDYENAAQAYARVVDAWAAADSGLAPSVAEAVAGLRRVTNDRSVRDKAVATRSQL
ncbi:MAG: protein kinase [Gemmatimonadaceae bacterium]